MFWKYLNYVIKHKWYVFVECCKLGIPLRGLLHDNSKFSLDEFIPYMKFFYGNKVIEPAVFDLAWLKHLHRNKHHWQYWVLKEDDGGLIAMEMSKRYMKEMFADWIGAGIAITGADNLDVWYATACKTMLLHKNTKRWIEKAMLLRYSNL